jgi:hypothetical protein
MEEYVGVMDWESKSRRDVFRFSYLYMHKLLTVLSMVTDVPLFAFDSSLDC